MQQSRETREVGELGYAQWLMFWVQLGVLAILAVLGAFVASANKASGDYGGGLLLSLASIGLAFMQVKRRFDGASPDWSDALLVGDIVNLVAVIVVFTLLALGGLFAAAHFDHGALHNGGVALFLTSGLAVFLSLKHVFDNIDRGH